MRYQAELDHARSFLSELALPGDVVFCALSGAHLYGFPSADSDLDLKGAFLAPTRQMLGLEPPAGTLDRTDWYQGVECDLTLQELAQALRLLLNGNGNVAEQLSSPHRVVDSDAAQSLRELLPGLLSKRFGRHYRGFLKGKKRDFDQSETPEVKHMLYGFRVAATGLHLMREHAVCANLLELAPSYAMPEVPDLVARKQLGGEHGVLSQQEKGLLEPVWGRLDKALEAAIADSHLPEVPPAAAAVDHWLADLRLAQLGAS